VAPPVDKKPAKKIVATEIYVRLKQLITSFTLFPGTRITEGELATMFGVSRTPVREAIKRLETEGFISVHSKQGCYVRDLDISELTEFYDVRVALEQLSVEAACASMPDRLVHQYRLLWDPARHDEDMAKGVDLSVKDEAFHIGLARDSGKQVLADMLAMINNRIRIIRRLDINSDKRSQRTYAEHYEILGHILERDATKAKLAIKRHIQRSRDFAKTLTLTALAQKKVRKKLKPPEP
jgi:DNA-binding GntR family transcriptional regulator